MFQTAPGVEIPFPEKIAEEYVVKQNCIILNISFEKLKPLFEDFLTSLQEPLFLFIHNPLNGDEEKKLLEKDASQFHAEVLYLDGQTKEQISEIMDQFGEILFQDGMSQFGVASHRSGDEIFIQKYKIVAIFSKDIAKYIPLMNQYGISETDHLITAWDTFSQEHPGSCSRVHIKDKDIRDVIKSLKEKGMYRAKIVKD